MKLGIHHLFYFLPFSVVMATITVFLLPMLLKFPLALLIMGHSGLTCTEKYRETQDGLPTLDVISYQELSTEI
jgi:hypothetical protein